MTRPTSRVLVLLELLQSGGTRTVAELAERIGVDGRTVRRYVDHLIDLDVPVESVRGRYGGYRLAPGYCLPPLMLGDDEALAVLLGLLAGRRAGLATALGTAGETASAKIRRVLPKLLARRLDSVLEALAFTADHADYVDRADSADREDSAGSADHADHADSADSADRADSADSADRDDRAGAADSAGSADRAGLAALATLAFPDATVLLSVADAVRHLRPISIRYTDREGVPSERIVHPYGIVSHERRWYVRGMDAGIAEERTFRLDRITDVRTLPGMFEPPAEHEDPARSVLTGFATAAYRHEVTVIIHATAEHVRSRLPASLAVVEPVTGARSVRVEMRVESLDWLPAVLASLDRPFEIERPDELRERVLALADRLATSARAGGEGALA
ncbi:WYL domain-containing protein [Actinospica sp. MGRD01-02]|uniref:WYL domain-containing protein n=1 Tax=Actinospica acidithermotolerans TaxID=2828514 RepID=A0A941IKK0_9ACTN|nr:WYL domain-containing protein [Actinospica acidithermotolerans]MBR7830684.1 WYL domain-containing protein [Actinospica acidithermotolerans]